MHQLQRQTSQPHFRSGSSPEKTSVARLRIEKGYNLWLEYASYASMGPVLRFQDGPPSPELMSSFPRPILLAWAQREDRNPRTGEKIKIGASKVVKFKAGKTLSEKVK
jgi:Bacterial DNA-binding protein